MKSQLIPRYNKYNYAIFVNTKKHVTHDIRDLILKDPARLLGDYMLVALLDELNEPSY